MLKVGRIRGEGSVVLGVKTKFAPLLFEDLKKHYKLSKNLNRIEKVTAPK
jgi:hydrogenase maturation factor